MGGIGSGSWYRWSKKSTTGNYHQLRMSRLVKLGVIKPNIMQSGGWQWTEDGKEVASIGYSVNTVDMSCPYIQLIYTSNKTENIDYRVYLKTTRPHYGGVRWWFGCQGKECGRCVAVLYGGKYFVCRHCYRLAYQTQNQAAFDRMCDRAFSIARQLGHDGNVIDGFYGKKPKGMHQKTYNRKKEEMERLATQGMAGATARFGKMF